MYFYVGTAKNNKVGKIGETTNQLNIRQSQIRQCKGLKDFKMIACLHILGSKSTLVAIESYVRFKLEQKNYQFLNERKKDFFQFEEQKDRLVTTFACRALKYAIEFCLLNKIYFTVHSDNQSILNQFSTPILPWFDGKDLSFLIAFYGTYVKEYNLEPYNGKKDFIRKWCKKNYFEKNS